MNKKAELNILVKVFKEEFELPVVNYDGEFKEHLLNKYKEYLSHIEFLQKSNIHFLEFESINKIKDLMISIHRSIEHQYSGRPDLAFKELSKGLNAIYEHLNFIDLNAPEIKIENEETVLYRVRKGNYEEFEKEDLFHIPLNLRANTNSYRYSIPGHPSLYLGSSSFVCWNEIGKPEFNNLHIAAYKVKNRTLTILDFGDTPNTLKDEVNRTSVTDDISMTELINRVKNYILIWPLIAACSYKVKDNNVIFKSEYIIPQLLLQWLRMRSEYNYKYTSKKGETLNAPKIDGVRYFSVSSQHSKNVTGALLLNYVFPTISNKSSNYCRKLAEDFQMTNPVVWGLANKINSYGNNKIDIYDNRKIQLMKDYILDYTATDFYRIEEFLKQKNYHTIENHIQPSEASLKDYFEKLDFSMKSFYSNNNFELEIHQIKQFLDQFVGKKISDIDLEVKDIGNRRKGILFDKLLENNFGKKLSSLKGDIKLINCNSNGKAIESITLSMISSLTSGDIEKEELFDLIINRKVFNTVYIILSKLEQDWIISNIKILEVNSVSNSNLYSDMIKDFDEFINKLFEESLKLNDADYKKIKSNYFLVRPRSARAYNPIKSNVNKSNYYAVCMTRKFINEFILV